MLKKIALSLLAVLALAEAPTAAQTYHWDFRPPYINDSTWWNIIGDHDSGDGHCDNTSGDQQGFPDVDCGAWNDSPQAPVQEVSQDCGSGSCTVSATVLCKFLNPSTANLITFTCSGSASGGVRAGNLGNGKKGVRCGSVECGCQLACVPQGAPLVCGSNGYTQECTNCPSVLFGNSTAVGGNYANRVCG